MKIKAMGGRGKKTEKTRAKRKRKGKKWK